MGKDITAEYVIELENALKPKQRRFCEEYDECGNATLAAQRAGYSPDNEKAAAVAGSRLLRNDKVAAYRRARAIEMYNSIGVSAETVALRLEKIYRRAMADVPHMSWDSECREYVPDGTWCFDGRTALKALELMGDSIGMFEKKISAQASVIGIEDYLRSLESDADKANETSVTEAIDGGAS